MVALYLQNRKITIFEKLFGKIIFHFQLKNKVQCPNNRYVGAKKKHNIYVMGKSKSKNVSATYTMQLQKYLAFIEFLDFLD